MDREWLYGSCRDDRVVQGFPRPPPQRESFSDEVSSRDGDEEMNDGSGPPAEASGGGDGLSVETGKRRRGRPLGSKNKPKPPPVVTRDVEPATALRPHVLEIPAGGDVARALAGFARRRGLGICVLSGTGAVADVSLRHPSPTTTAEGRAAVIFRGQYDILSISATFLPPSMSAAVPRAVRDLSISLAGPHGQIVGGAVAGPLIAATTVMVLAAAFTDLTFQRLPLEDDASVSVSGSGEGDEHRGHKPEPQEATRLQPHSMDMASASQPVPSNAHQRQDAWAPAATTQRPRPSYQ
ncbi:AT-hook motif nuclear-localized protein 17-like [Phragmites australis]|uniref:AT-hook motif nuclear-localized protein 17-like n=1 Tax=Phragmites australis TaxID=29695 RepID=UPI002D76BBC1|nr:AT-hook motif nuclear-localized protein 17-like [Phragmites australis]